MVEILALLKEIITKPSGEQPAAFSIRKSLQALQKPCINIVTCSSYTYLFLSYTYTLLFCCKIKCCCDLFSAANQATDHCSIVYITRPFQSEYQFQYESNATHCIQDTPCLFKYVKLRSLSFYSQLNKLCDNYAKCLQLVNLYCN